MAQAKKDVAKKLSGVIMSGGHVVGAKAGSYAGLDRARLTRYGYDTTKNVLDPKKQVNKPFYAGVKDVLDNKPLKNFVSPVCYMVLGKTAVVAIARECHESDLLDIYNSIEQSAIKNQTELKTAIDKKAKESNAKKEQSLIKQAESLGLDVEALKALLKAKEQ